MENVENSLNSILLTGDFSECSNIITQGLAAQQPVITLPWDDDYFDGCGDPRKILATASLKAVEKCGVRPEGLRSVPSETS